MKCEVAVVGGGVGGLIAAALLAARGVDVCLFERQSHVGGCVADFEHLGYRFEPTAGLYSGWEPGGIYERIFSELKIEPPRVERLLVPYVVRLPDQTEIPISENHEQFEADLRLAFPECAADAVDFYRRLDQTGVPDADSLGNRLTDCSFRFRRFIDIQLQTLAQGTADHISLEPAARALTLVRRGFWEIEGGAQALADTLALSLKRNGGSLRLDSPVLRLAYRADGQPTGIDLLSGEQVLATRAIISNLTIWDTYGKLIGLSRTPSSVSSQLRRVQGWSAYLLFLGMEQSAVSRLRSDRVLAITDWREGQPYSPIEAQFALAVTRDKSRAPDGKQAVTVSTVTEAADWFAFHEDSSFHDEKDQEALEQLWTRLHAAIPELGDSVEVIETATPQTFYETTRRKLGMVGAVPANDTFGAGASYKTIFPNVFLVGDTASPIPGLDGIAEAAINLTDFISGLTNLRPNKNSRFCRRLIV
jgi:phytoene dehydrogenase-like protein